MQGAGGTGFDAGRFKIVFETRETHVTPGRFFSFGVILRDIERTGCNTLLTADTFFLIYSDSAIFGVGQSPTGANSDASGVSAVHAGIFAEKPFNAVSPGIDLIKMHQEPGVRVKTWRVLIAAPVFGLVSR